MFAEAAMLATRDESCDDSVQDSAPMGNALDASAAVDETQDVSSASLSSAYTRSSLTQASDDSVLPLDLDGVEPLSISTDVVGGGSSNEKDKLRTGKDVRRSSVGSTSSLREFSHKGGAGSQDRRMDTPAQYVTVSSILSRSGAALPPSQYSGHETDGHVHWAPSRRKSQDKGGVGGAAVARRAASNGSALEALGALFLHRDSSGKVSNLSAARVHKRREPAADDDRHGATALGQWELATLSRIWMQSVNSGAQKLGIKMPKRHEVGSTIAQRRARTQASKSVAAGSGGVLFAACGTKSTHPTFEVGVLPGPEHEPVASRETRSAAEQLPPAPKITGSEREEPSPFLVGQDLAARSWRPAPHTSSGAIYGAGSAFSLLDPPEGPPSPVAMPGAWAAGGSGWARDPFEEGALLLPPPLLDDHGSDPQSFDGLLGIRRRREEELARKHLDILKARNRPAHKIGMLTAMSNFVKAARAADQAAKVQARRKGLLRSQTAPIIGVMSAPPEDEVVSSHDDDHAGAYFGARQFEDTSHGTDVHMRRTSSQQTRSSIDSSKALPTLYEAAPLESGETTTEQVYSARRASVQPRPVTPALGPTLTSLLPSPFTPYTHSPPQADTTNEQLLAQLGMTPVHGPPGTPRLAPSYLELASPYGAHNGHATPIALSPKALDAQRSNSHNISDPSPFLLSPGAQPFFSSGTSKATKSSRDTSLRRRTPAKEGSGEAFGDGRLTPSALLSQQPVPASKPNEVTGKTKDGTTTRRSLLLWFLIGNVGLKVERPSQLTPSRSFEHKQPFHSKANDMVLPLAMHIYGFIVFVLAHFIDLSYRCYDSLSTIGWLAKWLFLNLTGRTVLSQCVLDSYRIVRREWELVSKEDHEEKGLKRRRGSLTNPKSPHQANEQPSPGYRGLTRWQVVKGLIELYCLQDVTRERYLKEGAGLKELATEGRRSRSVQQKNGTQPNEEEMSSVTPRSRKRQDPNVIEEERGSSDTESSDDDMLVTKQGLDILEFVKTPRLGPKDSLREDSRSNIQLDSRKSDEEQQWMRRLNDRRPARAIVKTIKWASRLSISAYGLHVTLVDLPPTFTPSGDRFSRQTFAHLSRLHHEDVLHADIQTLDSDDYSPTFYLVRDMARRTIAVSVRGTQSLQDIIVDLDIVVEELKLNDDSLEGDERETYYCHAGVLRAAKALIARESTLFQTLSSALKANPDFDIVFTGHSLGGAIASTVVLLLSRFQLRGTDDAQYGPLPSSEMGEDTRESRQGTWVTHEASGLPAGRRIRAITFAHPATVSANLATRASRGEPPLVLTVTLGYDFVPRCGHGQAREVRRALGALSRVRRRKRRGRMLSRQNSYFNLSGQGEKQGHEEADEPRESTRDGTVDSQDHRIHIVTSWWRWRGIKRKGSLASKEELQVVRTIEDSLWRLRCDVENDLYTAVKSRSAGSADQASMQGGVANGDVVSVSPCHRREQAAIPPSPWIGPAQRGAAPLHQLAARRQALDAITLANEEEISQRAGGLLVPAGHSLWLYDDKVYTVTSPLSFFGMPDLHPQMFIHHFPSAYEDMLEGL